MLNMLCLLLRHWRLELMVSKMVKCFSLWSFYTLNLIKYHEFFGVYTLVSIPEMNGIASSSLHTSMINESVLFLVPVFNSNRQILFHCLSLLQMPMVIWPEILLKHNKTKQDPKLAFNWGKKISLHK